MKQLSFGLLGCGRIGKMHAGILAAHPGVKLAAVCDINQKAADEVAKQHSCDASTSAESIIERPDIDALFIATATDTHADLIEAAATANKHVLCEKPVDATAERAVSCLQKVADTKVKIAIGFQRRCDPTHRSCREAIVAGKVGSLRQVIITSRDPNPPPREYLASCGGILRDMSIHDLDMARFLLGEEPTLVSAHLNRHTDPEMLEQVGDHDCAMIVLLTDSGKQCVIINHRQVPIGHDQRIEAMGDMGMVQSGNHRDHEMIFSDSSHTEARAPASYFFIERYAAAYRLQLDSFVSAINEDREPEVGVRDGVRALVIAEAAYRSANSGKSEKIPSTPD